MKPFQKIYENLVLDHPFITLLFVLAVTLFFGFHTQNFRLDASSESLSLKNDQAVKYYRSIKARYGSDDYLVVTYTPRTADIFSPEILGDLNTLRDQLASLERVQSVTSIFDVPLMSSPPVTIEELNRNSRTLLDSNTVQTLARQELSNSPLYANLLMSEDGETTALFVNFHVDETLDTLFEARERLRGRALQTDFSKQEKQLLKTAEKNYSNYNALFQNQWQRDIADVRDILKPYKGKADIYVGGVPMIVADSIAFIARDLKIFGAAILSFLVLLLMLFFRKAQWVFLPMTICLCVGVCVIGFLGLMNWPVTIVSSNFISLLLIFTLSFCVHQIVRYRECVHENHGADQPTLVRKTMTSIGVPCFYMVFTTMVAFGSLVVSNIRPIIDFGWMMTFSLGVSFIISFTLMPAALMFMKPEKPTAHFDLTGRITEFFAKLVENHGMPVLGAFCVLIILSIWGMNFLYVQNRFIDYYKQDTEIYQGMVTIDQKLGGTTPLDIIIDAPQSFIESQKEDAAFMEEEGFGFGTPEGPAILNGYWFDEIVMKDAAAIHDYIESLPETGKVLSFYTTAELLQNLKDAKTLDRFYLGVLYNKVPDDVKDIMFTPYISEDGNQLRFSVRVFESREGLNRQEMLDKIHDHLTTALGLENEQVNLTGMLVLYNNVLQSLFRSQILTLWVVFIAMFAMFVLLFRNIWVALVAIVPNITITLFVLGTMGWMGIPLDMMTITIAAICFGIADDNTIHYVHRFMEEFKESGNYRLAVERSHSTIGRAMYYTSVTIILGFSILAFSNFVPTIYFGVLTGVSMLVALLADIALLPLLLLLFKPLGKERTI